MTAEIAILNRSAVALAADSAVTIGQKKIYNSANKLFTLSKVRPVGVMVYGNAELMGIPWETIIKHYRNTELLDKSFLSLKDYKDHFIEFLRTTSIFSVEHEERYAVNIVGFHLTKIRESIQQELKQRDKESKGFTDKDAKEVISVVINNRLMDLESQDFSEGGNEGRIKEFMDIYATLFGNGLEAILQKIPLGKRDRDRLFRICALAVFKKRLFGGRSGVVIAGFGEAELYPALESFAVEGRVRNFLKYQQERSGSIGIKNHSWIVPFAQSEMVSTFMNGIHPDLHSLIRSYLGRMFQELPNLLVTQGGDKKENLTKELKKVSEAFVKEWDSYAKKNFIDQILDSVEVLPKDELAAMAEALVNLTSFRRRVTMDQETVGGPIDVAVISKGDGFIWIKRKHYFEPSLNQHFMSNYFRGI